MLFKKNENSTSSIFDTAHKRKFSKKFQFVVFSIKLKFFAFKSNLIKNEKIKTNRDKRFVKQSTKTQSNEIKIIFRRNIEIIFNFVVSSKKKHSKFDFKILNIQYFKF